MYATRRKLRFQRRPPSVDRQADSVITTRCHPLLFPASLLSYHERNFHFHFPPQFPSPPGTPEPPLRHPDISQSLMRLSVFRTCRPGDLLPSVWRLQRSLLLQFNTFRHNKRKKGHLFVPALPPFGLCRFLQFSPLNRVPTETLLTDTLLPPGGFNLY